MNISDFQFHFPKACVAVCLMSLGSPALAQPLVADGLSVYYSFDSLESNGTFLDGSGNSLHGLLTLGDYDDKGDELDDIRHATGVVKRGTGSVLFDTERGIDYPGAQINDDYVAVCDPNNQPDHNSGCAVLPRPSFVPSDDFSVAAWLYIPPRPPPKIGFKHYSVWSSRAGGEGFSHMEIVDRSGPTLQRMALRGDEQLDEIVISAPGIADPAGDWFHVAGTYEKGSDPNAPGQYVLYHNGQVIDQGAADGIAAGDPTRDRLGDWRNGAFLGLVPDFNRQFSGWMDEFYLFKRALTADEIDILYNLNPPITGDLDNNGFVGLLDLNLVLDNYTYPWPPEIDGWINDQPSDGIVDFDDIDVVLLNWNAGTPPVMANGMDAGPQITYDARTGELTVSAPMLDHLVLFSEGGHFLPENLTTFPEETTVLALEEIFGFVDLSNSYNSPLNLGAILPPGLTPSELETAINRTFFDGSTLIETYSPEADFDSDGDVDGADFLAWQIGSGSGPGATKTDGDADADGFVNIADLATWQLLFGEPDPSADPSSQIPEPSTLAILLVAGLAVFAPVVGRNFRR